MNATKNRQTEPRIGTELEHKKYGRAQCIWDLCQALKIVGDEYIISIVEHTACLVKGTRHNFIASTLWCIAAVRIGGIVCHSRKFSSELSLLMWSSKINVVNHSFVKTNGLSVYIKITYFFIFKYTFLPIRVSCVKIPGGIHCSDQSSSSTVSEPFCESNAA